MAGLVFNVAKGAVRGYYDRVDNNDPTNSALVLVALAESGLESDATLIDKTTLSNLVSGTTNEVTNTGYARIILTDSDLAASSVDFTDDEILLVLPDVTFGSPNVDSGDVWKKLVVCYDSDTTSGTDANIIPLTLHDIDVTPVNLPVDAFLSTGFFRAQ